MSEILVKRDQSLNPHGLSYMVYQRSYDICMQLYEKDVMTDSSFLYIYGLQDANLNAQQLAVVADLAVVVLRILIPLISPNSSKGGVGFQAIAEALGLASLKAVIAISAIIAGGRLLLRPIYKQIAENQNAEIFSANTLLYKEETTDVAMAAKDAAEKSLRLADLRSSRLTYSMVVELGFRSWFM